MSKFCYIFILLLYSPLFANPKTQDIQFDHITTDDGLSNNCVMSILQDSRGFIWFGTSDGLNRWDGYSFKIFIHDPNDSNSISNNSIAILQEDASGFIWMGTGDGLNKYNPLQKKFHHYFYSAEDSLSISNNTIRSILEDKNNCLNRQFVTNQRKDA